MRMIVNRRKRHSSAGSSSGTSGGASSTTTMTLVCMVGLICFVLGYCWAQYSGGIHGDGSGSGSSAALLSSLSTQDWQALRNMASSSSSSSSTALSSVVENNNNNAPGWKSIDVFYGTPDHLDLGPKNKNKKFFGQVHQDKIVLHMLHQKRGGYFIDLAANDAVHRSNSLALERQADWTGLCIEPNPLYWKDLSYRACQTVAAVVGQRRDEIVHFTFGRKEWGGMVGADFDNNNVKSINNNNNQAKPQSTVTLLEILQRYQAPSVIDYLSLDCEGAESYVMNGFPFDRYRIKIITGERLKPDLQAVLRRHAFEMLGYLSKWGEQLWINTDFLSEMDVKGAIHTYPFYNMTKYGETLKAQ